MPRHNRAGRGVDQCATTYSVDYQPDWLRRVKVTRKLETGRQSTMNVFRNPSERREAEPGERVRTRLASEDEQVEFEITLADPKHRVKKITVQYELPPPERPTKSKRARRPKPQEIVFTLESGLKPPLEER